MPSTTTQETARAQAWARYLRLNAVSHDAHADAYEADRAAAEAYPFVTDSERAARRAHFDDLIASYRRMAASARQNADAEEADGCVCGGTGRLADAPCSRCASAPLHTEGAPELLAALGCEVTL